MFQRGVDGLVGGGVCVEGALRPIACVVGVSQAGAGDKRHRLAAAMVRPVGVNAAGQGVDFLQIIFDTR